MLKNEILMVISIILDEVEQLFVCFVVVKLTAHTKANGTFKIINRVMLAFK